MWMGENESKKYKYKKLSNYFIFIIKQIINESIILFYDFPFSL